MYSTMYTSRLLVDSHQVNKGMKIFRSERWNAYLNYSSVLRLSKLIEY